MTSEEFAATVVAEAVEPRLMLGAVLVEASVIKIAGLLRGRTAEV